MPRMNIVAPPRQTPVSMKSPGTLFETTSAMQDWRLSKRASGSIETAGPLM